MKADYLTLADERKVRILWNMNALGEFTKLTGREMTDLVDGKADVNTLRTIAWCSAVEGEAADGKELALDEIQFGRLITMEGIVAFSAILATQSNNSGQKKSPEKGRSPRIFFRKKA
jgi:hypothetical protein